jgi:hypothetical protein
VRFAFEPAQLALRDAVRDLLATNCPPAAVRAAWSAAPGGLDRAVWDRLADMGVCEVLIAALDGGLGLDWCSLVLLLEEAGRVALPHPMLETAAVAAPLLGRQLVELVGDGRSMGSVSLGGAAAPCGADADWLLLGDGGQLVLVARPDVAGVPVETVDGSRRLLQVTDYDRAMAQVVGEGPAALAAALDRGALGAAAQLIGLSQAMLDLTVAYVAVRQQFDVPIGSFQAVKHHLADALRELSFARPVVYGAAWSISVGAPTAGRDVAVAKAMASEAADRVGRAALQCHGAMGYSVEYDLHLFLKRAWALSRAWGDASSHRSVVAGAIGLGRP